jgi:hypothetical protein
VNFPAVDFVWWFYFYGKLFTANYLALNCLCGKMICGELACSELSCGEVSCGEFPCVELSCGELSYGELTFWSFVSGELPIDPILWILYKSILLKGANFELEGEILHPNNLLKFGNLFKITFFAGAYWVISSYLKNLFRFV